MKRNLNFVLIAVIFTLILTIIIFSYNDIDLAFADVTVLEALDYEYVIIGTDEKDRLAGSNSEDIILGLQGNDRIKGKGSSDYIDGGEGKDFFHGLFCFTF